MTSAPFQPTRASLKLRVRRLLHRLRDTRPFPATRVLKAATPAPRWTLYFCYTPDGRLLDVHHATLASLRAAGHRILIVVASADLTNIAPGFADRADALIWKSLEGYDFSGYAAGLRHLATVSPGSDVIVMNDSVIGPLRDLRAIFDPSPWNFTGLTSNQAREAHIQSYAFMIRGLTERRMAALNPVFPERICYTNYISVIRNQESRLARVASRSMSVGVIWPTADDATLFDPLGLIARGFPFIKRSHFGKFAHLLSAADKAELARHRDRHFADMGVTPEG